MCVCSAATLTLCHRAMGFVDVTLDERLMKCVERLATLAHQTTMAFPPASMSLDPEIVNPFESSSGLFSARPPLSAEEVLKVRVALLKDINTLYSKCLPLVSIGSGGHSLSLSNLMGSVSYLFYSEIKLPIFKDAIQRTTKDGWDDYVVDLSDEYVHVFGITVSVSVHCFLCRQAVHSVEAGIVEPSSSRCMFAQLCEAFVANRIPDYQLRRKPHQQRGILFHVRLNGQEGIDYGGLSRSVACPCVRFTVPNTLYLLRRSVLERSVNDLFSPGVPHISLFSVSPTCRDLGFAPEGSFIPNISHTSEQTMAMLRFAGKLMGIAMRYAVSHLWQSLASRGVFTLHCREC